MTTRPLFVPINMSTVVPSFNSEAKGSSREELNAFLACRDVSPVRHQLLTSWDSIVRRTQPYHIRKARRVVIAALEENCTWER